MTDPLYCPLIFESPCLKVEVWAAFWQTMIAALAAVATFLAVWAAISTSKQSILAAQKLANQSREELADKLAKQRLYLATAYVEELRENVKRLYAIRYEAQLGNPTSKLIWHLFHSMTLVQTPILDTTITEFACFSTQDAALFLRTAAKLSQIRRHGSANRPDTLPPDARDVIDDILLAVSKAPEIALDAMNRAYDISGVPREIDPRIEFGYVADQLADASD